MLCHCVALTRTDSLAGACYNTRRADKPPALLAVPVIVSSRKAPTAINLMILTEDMTSRSLLSHLLLMVVLGDGGKRLRRRRSAWALHDCCLCLLPALVTILITLSLPSFTLAGSICLEKCDCFYTRNKLIAGCGAKGLTDIPEVSRRTPRLALPCRAPSSHSPSSFVPEI